MDLSEIRTDLTNENVAVGPMPLTRSYCSKDGGNFPNYFVWNTVEFTGVPLGGKSD